MAMTSESVTITADTAAQFLPAAAAQTGQGKDTAVTAAATESADKSADKTASAVPVDTVVISDQVQKANQEPRKEEPVKKETDQQARKKESEGRTMGHVLFVYNLRGDLRVRFMDSKNKLIYQIPPVMVAKTMDLMSQFTDTVNMKA